MTSAVQGISVMLATQPTAGPPNPKAAAVAALSATTAAAPAVSASTVRLVTESGQSVSTALPVPAASSASYCSGSVVQAAIGVRLLVPW